MPTGPQWAVASLLRGLSRGIEIINALALVALLLLIMLLRLVVPDQDDLSG
jgi:hypothetical protein